MLFLSSLQKELSRRGVLLEVGEDVVRRVGSGGNVIEDRYFRARVSDGKIDAERRDPKLRKAVHDALEAYDAYGDFLARGRRHRY